MNDHQRSSDGGFTGCAEAATVTDSPTRAADGSAPDRIPPSSLGSVPQCMLHSAVMRWGSGVIVNAGSCDSVDRNLLGHG
jgi:hypothetical protein